MPHSFLIEFFSAEEKRRENLDSLPLRTIPTSGMWRLESVLSQVFLPDIVMLVGQPGQEGMSIEIIYVDI